MQNFKEKDPRTSVSPQLQKDRDGKHPSLKVRLNFCFIKSRMVNYIRRILVIVGGPHSEKLFI